jgi:hypothetical protein
MALGLGSYSASKRTSQVQVFSWIAFIGEPCPMKSVGMRFSEVVIMGASPSCAAGRVARAELRQPRKACVESQRST